MCDEAAFNAEVTARLAAIEEKLLDTAVGDSPFTTGAAQHVIAAGGKRMRPLLVILGSYFGSQVDEGRLVAAATVCEMTHVASLYHDDVMDEAEVRRGVDSANQKFGNHLAILVGDFLFAQASSLIAELGEDYVQLQAATFSRLVQGQIAETIGPEDGVGESAHYLAVLSDKTASLISTAIVFGGMVSGADEVTLSALGRYGEELGVLFQLADDLMDITSTQSGKQPGIDLRAGVKTLPLLLLAESADPADDALKSLLAGDLSSDEALRAALTQLRAHPVIEQARAELVRRAELAKSHIAELGDGPAKTELIALCDRQLARVS